MTRDICCAIHKASVQKRIEIVGHSRLRWPWSALVNTTGISRSCFGSLFSRKIGTNPRVTHLENRARSSIERGFGSPLDPPPYKENLAKNTESNVKTGWKVGSNSVSIIFHFALFWIFLKGDIFQNDPKMFENDPLMGDPWWAMSDLWWAMSDLWWAMSDLWWAMSDLWWTMSDPVRKKT